MLFEYELSALFITTCHVPEQFSQPLNGLYARVTSASQPSAVSGFGNLTWETEKIVKIS